MKKFLSIAAALAMVFAMAVPALAADPSVEAQPQVESAKTTDTYNSQEMEVVLDEATLDQPMQRTKLENALSDGETVGDIVDVELMVGTTVVTEDYFKQKNPDGTNVTLTVAFAYDDAGKVAKVLYWSEADGGKWDEANLISAKDGTVTVEFEHLCAVAFVLKTEPAPEGGGSTTGKNPPPGKPGSPQTGYNTVGWIAAAMAMMLCAGFCFISARKKTTA